MSTVDLCVVLCCVVGSAHPLYNSIYQSVNSLIASLLLLFPGFSSLNQSTKSSQPHISHFSLQSYDFTGRR